MTEQIARCAQSVRQELARLGEINILRLSEHLGERSLVVYQALGWLAREGRVRYRARGTQLYVSLNETPPERHDSLPRPTEVNQ